MHNLDSSGDKVSETSFAEMLIPILLLTAVPVIYWLGFQCLFANPPEHAAPEIKSTCDELAEAMVTDAFIRFGGELTPEVREQLQRSLRERLTEQPGDLRRIIREHAVNFCVRRDKLPPTVTAVNFSHGAQKLVSLRVAVIFCDCGEKLV